MSSSYTPKRAPLVDYHVHPDYSIDAEGSIHGFCRAAVERGLDQICFTTHYDAEPQHQSDDGWVVLRGRRMPVSGEWLTHYAHDIREAASVYAGQGLKVRLGLEIGYWGGAAAEVDRITAACQPDYLLGSVHWVDGYPLSYREYASAWLAKLGPVQALVSYYRTLTGAAASGLFDCMAHIDLFRRSLRQVNESGLDHPEVREVVGEFFAACVATGTGIEINTRSAPVDTRLISPGQRLLALAAESGVRTVVTGSDAHFPEAIGDGLAAGVAAARKAGLTHLTTFEQRVPTTHPL